MEMNINAHHIHDVYDVTPLMLWEISFKYYGSETAFTVNCVLIYGAEFIKSDSSWFETYFWF